MSTEKSLELKKLCNRSKHLKKKKKPFILTANNQLKSVI